MSLQHWTGTGTTQHKDTFNIRGNGLILETEAKKHTTHEQTFTKKEKQKKNIDSSIYTLCYGKTESTTQVKAKPKLNNE